MRIPSLKRSPDCAYFVWRRNCFTHDVPFRSIALTPLLLAGAAAMAQSLPQAPSSAMEASILSPAQQASPSVAPAQSATPSTLPANAPLVLTLSDAIAMASSSNPRLHVAQAVTDQSLGAAKTARAYTNPNIEVFEGRQYSRPIPTPGVPGLLQHYAGYQTIEIPSERRARQQVAQYNIASSRAAQRGASITVIADVKHTFYETLRRREEIRHAQENLQLVQDLHRRVEVEVSVGEKGRLELTRAEAELARAQFAVRSAQIEYRNAIALLRVVIAAPADANLEPRGELASRMTLPPIDQARQSVLSTHPAVIQSTADIQAAQATLDQQRLLRIPQPQVFGEFENQPDLRFWRTGVNIPIPLWDRRRGQIEQAQATIRQSNAVLDQRRLELISALERAYEQYQLADQQVTSLQSGSLRAAESAVDAAKAAYRYGERGIVEVLDAQRVLQSVRGDLLDAEYARQSAIIDLEELGAIAPPPISGAKP